MPAYAPLPVAVEPHASCAVSIVLPCFNEAANLTAMRDRLVPVLSTEFEDGDFEILFVDDASTDESARILHEFHNQDPRCKVLRFSRNFGHQAALGAGLEQARGRAVVQMDCDLQDPPEVLSQFFAKWREGAEIVYGVRRARKEGFLMRLAYSAFYRSLRMMANIEVPLDAGDFCLLDRKVVDALNRFDERHVFWRGLRAWVGFSTAEVEYERQARHAGEPKYTLRRLIRLAISGYIGFSSAPLRLAGLVGSLAAIAGFGVATWAILSRMLSSDPIPPGWASIVSIVLVIGGLQLLVLGIIGEYLARVYDEVRQRPRYLIAEQLGFER